MCVRMVCSALEYSLPVLFAYYLDNVFDSFLWNHNYQIACRFYIRKDRGDLVFVDSLLHHYWAAAQLYSWLLMFPSPWTELILLLTLLHNMITKHFDWLPVHLAMSTVFLLHWVLSIYTHRVISKAKINIPFGQHYSWAQYSVIILQCKVVSCLSFQASYSIQIVCIKINQAMSVWVCT